MSAFDDDTVDFDLDQPTPTTDPPGTPRVARSVDDLRVGMVVQVHGDGIYEVKRVMSPGGFIGLHMSDEPDPDPTPTDFRASCYRNSDGVEWCGILGLVILSDPPAPPAADWLVPAEAMEALREALSGEWLNTLEAAARAVLDAATEVEHE